MNDIIIQEKTNIKDLIYKIRDKYVMLDSDLAKIYECKNGTKSINLAVNRNSERFPNDFYFQLTKEEYYNLKFQIETSKLSNNYGGIRKMPYVFTQEGVAMLSSVLRTNIAAKVSVDIMRAFVLMKKYLNDDLIEQRFYKKMLIKHDNDIKLLQESFEKLTEKDVKNEIYFSGQIYDAYSKILDIFSKAKKELIIIDSYADKIILDIISRFKINIILITSEKGRLSDLDIEKYNKQYNNLEIIYDNTYHDRYFILDNKIIYHCGTSLNYIGYKTFSINKIGDDTVIKLLIHEIKDILSKKEK